jgi:hypothetical protein
MKSLIGFLLVVFIITVSLYNEYNETQLRKEGFTTYLRQIIRPHVRKVRNNAEGFYTRHRDKLYNIVRKFGKF